MRFDCSGKKYEKWHRWFAWHPATLPSGECVWLETIWRKGTYYSSVYDTYYRYEYSIDPPT